MLKRYTPTQPDGINKVFDLPDAYVLGTEINLFVNGQLINAENDTSHPLGYFLDSLNKIFTFYEEPYVSDYLYVMYEVEDIQDLYFDNIDWSKKVRKIDFTSTVNKQVWKVDTQKVEWDSKPIKINWSIDSKKIDWKLDTKVIEFKYKSCSSS